MSDVKISSIRIVDSHPSQSGLRLLAIFTCDVSCIRIKGCQLMRTEKNGLSIWLPTFRRELDGLVTKSVTILDDSLHHAVLDAARSAYRAIGGTKAEWEPARINTVECV